MVRREITLEPRAKGFHDVTGEVVSALPELGHYRTGLVHLMIMHTSASLAITENASPDVLRDLEDWFSDSVPERRDWAHSLEGPDDMPAHVRSVLTQVDLTLPIEDGRLELGTWQGVFLCEHRDHGGSRRLVATLWGDRDGDDDGPGDH